MSKASQYGNPHPISRRLDKLIRGRCSVLLLGSRALLCQPHIQLSRPKHICTCSQTKKYIKSNAKEKRKLPLNKSPQKCKYIQTNTWSHILKCRRYCKIPPLPPANPHPWHVPLPCRSSGIREIAWNERNMFFDGPFFMHMVAQDAAGLFSLEL